jgi:hypothetical protein
VGTLRIYPDCRQLGCGAGDCWRCTIVATLYHDRPGSPAIILSSQANLLADAQSACPGGRLAIAAEAAQTGVERVRTERRSCRCCLSILDVL